MSCHDRKGMIARKKRSSARKKHYHVTIVGSLAFVMHGGIHESRNRWLGTNLDIIIVICFLYPGPCGAEPGVLTTKFCTVQWLLVLVLSCQPM